MVAIGSWYLINTRWLPIYVQCTWCTVYIVHCTLNSVQYVMQYVNVLKYYALYTVYCTVYTIYTVQCTQNTLYKHVLNHTWYILYRKLVPRSSLRQQLACIMYIRDVFLTIEYYITEYILHVYVFIYYVIT